MNDREKYKADLIRAKRQLLLLTRQREETDIKIARLRQDIGALAQLCGEPVEIALGLADACREVLRAADSNQWLTAGEIKDSLERIGFPVNVQSNIIASITTTLRRMILSQEVLTKEIGGKRVYRLRPIRA